MADITYQEVTGQDSPNTGRAKINSNFSSAVSQINAHDTKLTGQVGSLVDEASNQTLQNKTISTQNSGQGGNNTMVLGIKDIKTTVLTFNNDYVGSTAGTRKSVSVDGDASNNIIVSGVGGFHVYGDNTTAGSKKLTYGFPKSAYLDYAGDGAQTFVINASGIISGYTHDVNGHSLVRSNLGIGDLSTVPAAQLHIFENSADATIILDSQDHDTVFDMRTNADGSEKNEVHFSKGASAKGKIIYDHNALDADSAMVFRTAGVGTNQFTLRGDGRSHFAGRLGIGISAPTVPLEIVDALDTGIKMTSTDSAMGIDMRDNATTSEQGIWSYGNTLRFKTENTDRVFINSNGLGVGAGATASYDLDVQGNGETSMRVASTNNSAILRIQADTSGTKSSYIYFQKGTDARGSIKYDHTGAGATEKMLFFTNDISKTNLGLHGNGQTTLGSHTPVGNYALRVTQTSNGQGYGILLDNPAGLSGQLWQGTGGLVLESNGNSDLHFRQDSKESSRVYSDGANAQQTILHANSISRGLTPNAAHGTYGNQDNFPNKTGGVHILGPSAGLQEGEINWTLEVAEGIGSDSNYGQGSQRGIRIGMGGSGSYSSVPHSHRAVGITAIAGSSHMNLVDMGFWCGGAASGAFAQKMTLRQNGTLIVNGTGTAADSGTKLVVKGKGLFEGDVNVDGNISCNELIVSGAIASSQTQTLSQVDQSDSHTPMEIISRYSPNSTTKPHGILYTQDAGYSFNGTGFVGFRNITDQYHPHFVIGNNGSGGKMIVQARGCSAVEISRGTNAQAPVTGSSGSNISCAAGSIRYNTTHSTLDLFTGTKWIPVNTPPIGSTYIQWHQSADPHNIYHDTS